jgi:hypothetical protein
VVNNFFFFFFWFSTTFPHFYPVSCFIADFYCPVIEILPLSNDCFCFCVQIEKKQHFQIFQKPSGTWTQLSCKLKCTLENEKHLTETVCVMSGKSRLCQHVCPIQWFLNSSSTNWMIWTL